MKLLICLTFFLLSQISFSQQIDERNLNKVVRAYENSENQVEKDSLWNIVINNFEASLEIENFGGMSTQNRYNENKLGYEFVTIRQFHSENNKYTTHSISRGTEYWNYVTQQNLTNQTNKIILKKLKATDYYTEIHALNANEFLLLTRFDEMSFSCYNAYVIKHIDNYNIRQNAFNNKQDVLSICSWTNVDESFPEKKDSKTGLYSLEGGIKHYEPIEISFNPKNNTISYSFNRLKDGKKITRKAEYKKGRFKIKDYDARTFEE